MDLTVAAVPGYFATMGAEYLWLRRRSRLEGPSAADYERRDTVTSLTMGVGSLLAPIVMSKVLAPFTPGRGRFGKALVATAVGAAATTTVADTVARRLEARAGDDEAVSPRNRRWRRLARRVASIGGVTAVAAGGVAVTTKVADTVRIDRMWDRRILPDLGSGPLAWAIALVGWDFIYYWNHRLMHEIRFLWAIHVVHHSSERYNLSTALRQPVADAFGVFVPYGALAALGVRPGIVAQSRAINLIYQYWIHTDAIRRLGPAEAVLNTPSHHRVHHGSNRQYLDRNHGGILITWDRLFGTFEPEREPVVYGLTRNVDTFNPARVATHEHADMLADVAASTSWSERLSYVVRGPGWAYERRAERGRAPAEAAERVPV